MLRKFEIILKKIYRIFKVFVKFNEKICKNVKKLLWELFEKLYNNFRNGKICGNKKKIEKIKENLRLDIWKILWKNYFFLKKI